MQESLKGLLIAVTVILIFITGVINFIVLFPQEQGVTFTGRGQSGYLTMATNNNTLTSAGLNNLSNSSTNAFDQWDITTGFMGSNSMKQGQTGIGTGITNVFGSLTTMATLLFTSNSPIVYVIGILTIVAGIVLIYTIYTFVRQGK